MGDSRQGDVSEVGGARRRDGLEEEFRFLVEAAQVYGAEVAALIPSTDVVADERVTLKCAVPVCQGYGNYLYCPPNTLSVTEFRAIRARYRAALVVQVVSGRGSEDLDTEGLARKDVSGLEEELHGEANRLLGRVISRVWKRTPSRRVSPMLRASREESASCARIVWVWEAENPAGILLRRDPADGWLPHAALLQALKHLCGPSLRYQDLPIRDQRPPAPPERPCSGPV